MPCLGGRWVHQSISTPSKDEAERFKVSLSAPFCCVGEGTSDRHEFTAQRPALAQIVEKGPDMAHQGHARVETRTVNRCRLRGVRRTPE
jgi:hypothetical protein